MNNLFFKDIRDNYWAVSKIMGFVKDTKKDEEEKDVEHFLVILEGGMSTEINTTLYYELVKSLVTLEATEAEK